MSFLESRAVITSGAGDALTYTLESSVVAEYIKNEKELKEIYDIPRV
jgi:hypothetical protein